MANEYVKLWISYEAYFEPLSAAEVGRLALAMMKYKSQGVEPVFSGNERFVWPAIKRDIDAQIEAQESVAGRNRINGASGGRPKNQEKPKKPSGFSENPENPEKPTESHGQGQGQGQGHKEKDITDVISKKKYGEFENVLLSDTEREKLDDQLGDICAEDYIEKMSAYIAQSGTKYKSHYAAILTWWRKDGKPVRRHAKIGIMPPDNRPRVTVDDIFGPEPPLVIYEKRE